MKKIACFANLTALLTLFAGSGAVGQVASDAELAARFSINGVLVSQDNQFALINDQLTRIGEHIDGAEVIAIESSIVHLQTAQQTFAMRVGSSVIRDSRFADSYAAAAHAPAQQLVQLSPDIPTHRPLRESRDAFVPAQSDADFIPEFPPEYSPAALAAQSWYGPVAPGETLSEIASTLAENSAQRDAVMAALFESNPQAFGASMDLLYAGARLSLPSDAVIVAPTPERSAALPAPQQAPQQAQAASSAVYVPVSRGDTLSEIALRLKPDRITLNQLMVAIYAANPHSFGGNLNVLYAGAVLQIPAAPAWQQHSPEAALAEVVRQASAWAATRRYNST